MAGRLISVKVGRIPDQPAGTITHGFQINPSNTGYQAYVDQGLGRALTLADLTVQPFRYVSDLVAPGGTLIKQNFASGVRLDIACKLIGCIIEGQAYVEGSGTEFDYCSIGKVTSGSGYVPGDYGIGYGGYTARRCNIGGGSDGIKTGANAPTLVSECYIRTMSQSAADHNDGMQDSGGSSLVTIERCNVDVRPVNGGGGVNGCLFAADACTGPHHWYDNYLLGGNYTMRMHENATYDVQGNWVADGTYLYYPTIYTNTPVGNIAFGTVRPNLLVDSAGNPLSTIALS